MPTMAALSRAFPRQRITDCQRTSPRPTRWYPRLWCTTYWAPGLLLLLARWLEPLCGRNFY